MDPTIHQAVRLQVMAMLQRNRELSFVQLRRATGTTDGNLNAHGAVLQRAGYIEVRRALTRRGFAVRYRLTAAGAEAFERYAAELQALLAAASRRPSGEGSPAGQRMAAAHPDTGPSRLP